MFNFFEKADARLQQDVMNELNWDPSVSSSEISVMAKDGVVTLRGNVPHYIQKATAEKAAQRVGGVRAIADELEVSILTASGRSDGDIAIAALNALEWNYQVPAKINVIVEKGWLTLRGEVEWDYQRTAARDAVASLVGVNGVTNEISIKSKVQQIDVKTRIEEALKRSAESEGRNITVSVQGNRVTLSGDVHSLTEIEDARVAAWSAPGVTSVQNDLKVAA